MKIFSFLESIKEVVLYVIFYLSRGCNASRAIRDLAMELWKEDLLKLSFSLRHQRKMLRTNNVVDDRKIVLLLESLEFPLGEIKKIPLRLFNKYKITLESNIAKLEDKLTIIIGIKSFIPTIIALAVFFNMINFFEGSLFMAISLMILYNFIPSFRYNVLEVNIAIPGLLLSVISGFCLALLYQGMFIGKILAVIVSSMFITYYFWTKNMNEKDLCKELLDTSKHLESLLSWLMKYIKKGFNLEYATREFVKVYLKEKNYAKKEAANWIFLKRHGLKSDNNIMKGLSMIYSNADLEEVEYNIETVFTMFRNSRTLIANFCHKIKILEFRSKIIQCISSLVVSIILSLASIFENRGFDIIFFIVIFQYFQIIFSYKISISYGKSDMMKYMVINIIFAFLTMFCLEFVTRKI
ncbi:MAG: hypothetical protein DRJ39_00010 [Thermoprotei archaeon]|nr:MAG: hypothetical protein DRZ80_06050 [Thermoprotei archaeon]RLE86186.1 MAG: hypothetical protein DRJ39_00010 [Thermoprotei archaeon]